MKPLALTIKNFGPYAGPEARIDFSRLDRFFLIAGDTGSGKTSIFDAISYAIYGKPLGTRSEQTLRSQFAPDTESCAVTFDFATLTERYEVTRSPYWIERKERGAGLKKAAENLVVLRRPLEGGVWLRVTKDTNPEGPDAVLARAIGFSHDEFSKLVVLPQGQFQQFLEMDSSRREALLKQLFPVEDHERLAALAAERAKSLEQEGKDLRSRQAEVRKAFDPDTAQIQCAELKRREAEEAGRSERSEQEFERMGTLLAEARLLSGQFESLAGQQDRLQTLLSQAEVREVQRRQLAAHGRAIAVRSPMDQAAAAIEARNKAEGDLRTLAADVKSSQDREGRAREAAEGLDLARGNLQGRREALRDLEARKGKLSELVAMDAQIAVLRKSVDDAQEELDAAGKSRDRLLELQRNLEGGELRAQTLRRERESLQARSSALVPLESDAKRLVQLRDTAIPNVQQAWEGARSAAEEAAGELAEAEEALRKAEIARDRNHAAALAEKLESGQPCPVCGSLVHPVLASFGEEAEPELLEICQSLLTSARKRLQDTRELLGIQSNDLAQKREAARAISEALAAAGIPSPEILLERLADLRKRETSLLAELKPLDEALSARPQVIEELRASAESMKACQAKRSEAAQLLERNQGGREQVFLAAGSPEDPRSAHGNLERQLKNQQEMIVLEEAAIERIEEQARVARELLASTTAASEQKAKDLLALEARLETLEASLATALFSAGFEDGEAVRSALLPDETVASLNDSLKAYDSEIDNARGAIESLMSTLQGEARPDLKALEAQEAEARACRDSARQDLQRAQSELQVHLASSQRWGELLREEEELRERGAVFLELSNDLNGLGGEGRLRLSFAGFVLGRWLRQVLEQGSRRLATLSGGRYRFLHNEVGADGRKRSGLEIDVHDSHAGGVRGVGTLSGGEKFLASLSLALGLSDVIQALAGGRRLDALFIDEGFGSLDGDSLDRAIAVLEEIGEGRQVGIISHVESLKKSIASQIRVEKGPAGSRLVVIGSYSAEDHAAPKER
jgi:exonuclease SbcC